MYSAVLVWFSLLMVAACKKDTADNFPEVIKSTVFDYQSINMTAWGRDWWNNKKLVDKALRFIIEEGCNTVTFDWAVNFKDDGHIVPPGSPESFHPSMEVIAELVKKAHRAGLRVILKPHVTEYLTSFNRNIWNTDTSTFRPQNFFDDYTQYLLQLGSFAQNLHVEMICIGTELNHLDWHSRSSWVVLIDGLRTVYNGKLTYDALFDRWMYNKSLVDVVFWDKLDFIGASLYVPLTTDDNAPVDLLREAFFRDLGDAYGGNGWFAIDDVIGFLSDFSNGYQKPFFIIESGYPSQNQGLWNVAPPNPSGYAHYDLQRRGLEAFLGVMSQHRGNWLKGVSLWCITPKLLDEGALQTMWHTQDFNFYQKPAAEVVKSYFRMNERSFDDKVANAQN